MLTRIAPSPLGPSFGAANIQPRWTADTAAWVWHPARPVGSSFLRFSLDFHLVRKETLNLQVSADQRFQLALDGVEFAYGPDRSDLAHWTVQAYRGEVEPGAHTLTALVWWIDDAGWNRPAEEDIPVPPMAQATFRGGFLLAASPDHASLFNTGIAPWQVEDLSPAVALRRIPMPGYHDIGPSFTIDGDSWRQPGPAVAPSIVREAIDPTKITGVALPGWRLESTPLPEQKRAVFQGGTIREVRAGALSVTDWQKLLDQAAPLTLPPHSTHTMIWDLVAYRCGYPIVVLNGGKGSALAFEWAETLYENTDTVTETSPKGHRDLTEGKVFLGFGDRFLGGGDGEVRFPAFWWRSGRYVRVTVTTAATPLTIERLGVLTTNYPLEADVGFSADDQSLDRIGALALNTLRQGTHELMADSPYYEQMAYVGDNLIETLIGYTITPDTRMARRAITLFDWSRSVTGLVAERWPCACYQGSTTYAMLWPDMVWNHALWRDESDFVQTSLRGVRHLVEELLAFQGPDSLLGPLPAWSFVDWVPEWNTGYPPGHATGDSSIIQLHWLMTLRAAASLEDHFGDADLARRLRRRESETAHAIVERYRCTKTGLFFDDSDRHLSEHANTLATLTGLRPETETRWPEELAAHSHVRCTVYFTHYLFEAFRLMRRDDLFFARLELWRNFLDYGLRTIPEQPEPTRSDCHAWGAHPLFHVHATIAGIRPDAPGFRRVSFRPMLGPLQRLEGSLPHPRGTITYRIRSQGGTPSGTITLPDEITGTLILPDKRHALTPGENRF